MAGSKKPRKTISKVEQERRMRARKRQLRKNNPIEAYKDDERAHFIRQFRALNEPMTERRMNYGFGPLERAVFEIEETGEGHTDQKGNYIFLPDEEEGIWYSLTAAITKACDTFELMGVAERVAGLRRLAKRLELRMPVFKEDMDAARAGFLAMREAARELTPNQLIALVDKVDPDNETV